MAEHAPDRLARMLALVAYLRDHPAVPVEKVAEHFGISTSTVLADVNTLWVSGTPGYLPNDLIDFSSDDLERGVLTLVDARQMDRPLRLSAGEAVALLVALESLAATVEGETAELVAETITTLRQAAGEAAAAADAVSLGQNQKEVRDRAAVLRQALSDQRRVHLRYVSASDTTTERDVDPLQLLTDTERWFLLGWCHRAQAVRQFRVDRILDVQVLPQRVDAHPEVSLTGRSDPDTTAAQPVRLVVGARSRWLAEQVPGAEVTDRDDGTIEITIGVLDPAWLDNLVLAIGDDVHAIEPADVDARIRSRALQALDAYRALGLND